MKNSHLAIIVATIVLVFGGPPVAHALAAVLGDIRNCADITVGATAQSTQVCMGSYGDSINIQNESTTCIRVGGSGVTTTTGMSVGSGCASGSSITVDAKRAWMISSGADVTGVDVTWGNN